MLNNCRGRLAQHLPTNPAIWVRFSAKPNVYWRKTIFALMAIKHATPFQKSYAVLRKNGARHLLEKADFH